MNNDKEYEVVIIKDEPEITQPSNDNDKYRSRSEAINFDYDFSISDIIAEACKLVNDNNLFSSPYF